MEPGQQADVIEIQQLLARYAVMMGALGSRAGPIYDVLVRDTATYLPDLGMVKREPPRFILNYIPVAPPSERAAST